MWIKMLTDQVGPDGIFLKGQTVSLPQKIVAKLDSNSYIEVEMDEHRMQQLGIEDRLRSLNAESTTLDATVQATRNRLNDVYQRRKILSVKVKDAEYELKQIAEAKAEADVVPASEKSDEQKKESKDEGENQQ